MPSLEITTSLADVDPTAWDALVGDDNPFVEHAFLAHLERSGSVGARTGWRPHHLLVRDDDGTLVGAAPTYVKDHSYGEYIFDWAWADAAHRAGIDYYPKVVIAVPHTPATGPRLLVHRRADRAVVEDALGQGALALAREVGASSVHALFTLDDEARALERSGYHRRATHQYHWRNAGYATFDDFLSTLRAEVRKQIKRERRKVQETGLEITVERGNEVSRDDWLTMDRLYRSTSGRKWGSPYLTKRFFEDARDTVGPRALLCFARDRGEIVAGTLSFAKGNALFGRYWGAFKDVELLHFELCYYRLIEHAIDAGMTLVEAGAQGEHKVKRGYLPVVTHSAHAFLAAPFDDAIARHLARERPHVEAEVNAHATDGPFKDDARPPFPLRAGVPLVMPAR